MSVYGVIFAAYGAADTLANALAPWLVVRDQARKAGGPHQYLIAAVSVPFEGFDAGPDDGTQYALKRALDAGEIDHLITGDTPMKETEARGAALQWLVANGATDLLQWDADEIATLDQIARITSFWEARPMACWARLSYKNRVFTRDQFLVEPFQPPRIHRVNVPGHRYHAHSFYQDNNVAYAGDVTRDIVPDTNFASITVPPGTAFIEHLTWLNDGPNGRSRRKQAYQWARWGTCTFDWDDSRGGLIFRDGLPAPEVARDTP